MQDFNSNNQTVIGVIGAGNMGSGIAQKYATENIQVILLDLNQESLQKGKERIENMLAEGVLRRVFHQAQKQDILNRLKFTTNLQDLAEADLIIEAVFEDKNTKKELFQKLDTICHAKTIFATNTSSFYVTDLASATQRADRFVGLHYFYHPAKNKLVEVIKGTHTSENTFKTVWNIQNQIGKIPVASKDSPGFIVNRFFVPWLNEAMRIVEEGVANIATVEAAAKKTFEIGMGPFELMNVTGIPITLHAATTLASELGSFYAPCPLINSMTATNKKWDLSGKIENHSLDIVSSRLLGVAVSVATQLVLCERVCSIEDCDLGARVGLRWKKGPFELMGNLAPQFVLAHQEDKVGFLTFNRPDTLNALNETVVAQLSNHFAQLSKNPEIHGIVITAKGKAFVAGADTHFFVEQIEKNKIERIVEFAQKAQDLFYQIDTCPKPVVCAIDGLTLGGGLELALSCDFLLATSKTKLGFPETGIGIYPGLGGTQRTPKRIGIPLARWLILTGEIIPAKTAQEIGLIDEIIDSSELIKRAKQLVLGLKTQPEKRSLKPLSKDFIEMNHLWEAPLSDLIASQKKLTFKAPLALKAADKLIKDTSVKTTLEGLKTETAGLYDIFKTADAFLGLSSIGKAKPAFTGN